MKLRLQRRWLFEQETIGELWVDGAPECFTLEPKRRPDGVKIPDQTAVPAGDYPVVMQFSPRFQRTLPHILDISGFQGIEIHIGNSAVDTHGCVLLGQGVLFKARRIIQSQMAFAAVFALISAAVQRNEPVRIEIRDAVLLEPEARSLNPALRD